MARYLLFADTVLIVVFAVAATAKARSVDAFRAFAQSLRRLGVTAPAGAHRAVAAVIACEFAIALLLAWSAVLTVVGMDGPWRTGPGSLGLISAAVLLIVFSAGIGVGLRRGSATTCQCFGPSATVLGCRTSSATFCWPVSPRPARPLPALPSPA